MPPFPLRMTSPVQVIAAATLLTSSYVAGTLVSADEANMLALDIIYTKGDETSMQVKVEATNDSGVLSASTSSWYQQVTQTASAGTVAVAPAVYSMTAASAATVQKWTLIINPVKGTGYKISMQATGGTPTGTASIQAYTGWV